MFRSSFHPIPPSPSSGIYTTVASIKNDKEHLTWILLCRVQNVLFFPFTGRKKLKSLENQPLSVYQPLKNFACSGVYFHESLSWAHQEPFFSLTLFFKGNLPVYISLSSGLQYITLFLLSCYDGFSFFNSWESAVFSFFTVSERDERSFDLDGYLALINLPQFSQKQTWVGSSILAKPPLQCKGVWADREESSRYLCKNLCPQAAGLGRRDLFANMDN